MYFRLDHVQPAEVNPASTSIPPWYSPTENYPLLQVGVWLLISDPTVAFVRIEKWFLQGTMTTRRAEPRSCKPGPAGRCLGYTMSSWYSSNLDPTVVAFTPKKQGKTMNLGIFYAIFYTFQLQSQLRSAQDWRVDHGSWPLSPSPRALGRNGPNRRAIDNLPRFPPKFLFGKDIHKTLAIKKTVKQ